MRARKSKFGFTLIELMITISIMGILTVVMIPAIRSFDRRNKVTSAAEQLKSAILEARNYSMSPRFSDTNIDRYSVMMDLSQTPVEYEVGYFEKTTNTWHSIAPRKLPKGVTVDQRYPDDANPNDMEIGFMVPAASVKFENLFDYTNQTTWPAASGIGTVKLCGESASCGDSKTVKINSYTGLVLIE
ncbi:MAG: prepilin-type N-terminal cleavage/methylation domain-containing protein [bacterium]|nr:prepilin-type N-terminal cleavage/methylation domain-containing protein [bacterium]